MTGATFALATAQRCRGNHNLLLALSMFITNQVVWVEAACCVARVKCVVMEEHTC